MILLQSELEKLRVELGVDTDTAAEAYLNSKVQQLESQMQNMQVGYTVLSKKMLLIYLKEGFLKVVMKNRDL